MKTYKIALLLPLGLVISQDQPWEMPSETYQWSFPRDHWAHERFRTEWWYATGFLESESNTKQYAFQFTMFRIGISPEILESSSSWSAQGIVMGHAALTDEAAGTHRFAEVFYRSAPLLAGVGRFPDSTIAWSRAAPGSSGEWRLTTIGESFVATMMDDDVSLHMDLSMTPDKSLVFQGPNGFSKKNASGTAASMYYTFPRLSVTGTIVVDDRSEPVRGTAWMDREFSSGTLSDRQIGWDWFGLQLDDGRDVMLYVLRDSSGAPDYAHATMIDPSGQPRYLTGDDWSLRSTGSWTSPTTNIAYPLGWELIVPSENIDVKLIPLIEDQENVSKLIPRLNYWEGAVTMVNTNGERIGRGFGELTGYGGSRPAV